MASRYGGITGTEQIANDYQNINTAFEAVEADVDAKAAVMNDHINSTAAHTSEHISYNGEVSGANNIKEAVDTVKTTLDQAIISGDSGPEAAAARASISGTTYPTLKDRLDSEYTDVTAQLADLALNVKSFGAVGDGVTDDSSSVQEAINYVALNGGELYFPPGTYALANAVSLTSSVKPFSIRGSGMASTIFVRISTLVGTPFIFQDCDNIVISNFGIVCNNGTIANASHGLAFNRCNHVLVDNIKVSDWLNTAIIFMTPDDHVQRTGCIVRNCIVDGLNAANNGILLSTLNNSGIENCQAINIGKTGSPCYALQLKNDCDKCWIHGGLATGASAGIAFGQEIGTTAVKNSIVSDVIVFNCTYGIIIGYAENNIVSNINIDMNNTGNHAVSVAFSKYNNINGLTVKGVTSSNRVVSLSDGSIFNSISIELFVDINNTAVPVRFLDTSQNNYVIIKNKTGTLPTLTQNLVTTITGDTTNVFILGIMPPSQEAVISNDEIVVAHRLITRVRIDTEGASATDNLSTISAGYEGQTITLTTKVNARDVTIKHGTGNIRLSGGVDLTLGSVTNTLTLTYITASSVWVEISRGTA